MHRSPGEIDCRTAVERLWEYLDAEGESASIAEVEGHLATCLDCPQHFEFARKLLQDVRATGGLPPEGRRVRAVRVRVIEALRAYGFQEAGA